MKVAAMNYHQNQHIKKKKISSEDSTDDESSFSNSDKGFSTRSSSSSSSGDNSDSSREKILLIITIMLAIDSSEESSDESKVRERNEIYSNDEIHLLEKKRDFSAVGSMSGKCSKSENEENSGIKDKSSIKKNSKCIYQDLNR
ncbi:19466_t:CDS:2 [Funneliformis geosporum]|nr:19466_t:CDS:2 [Funneliformis geosporum]